MLSFLEGVISAFSALIIELAPTILNIHIEKNSLIFFLFTAIVEEIVKYIFIYNHYLKLNSKENILRDSSLIGLGFALTELVFKKPELVWENFYPVSGVFLVHIITSLFTAILLRKKGQSNIFLNIIILDLNILLHFIYNVTILYLTN